LRATLARLLKILVARGTLAWIPAKAGMTHRDFCNECSDLLLHPNTKSNSSTSLSSVAVRRMDPVDSQLARRRPLKDLSPSVTAPARDLRPGATALAQSKFRAFALLQFREPQIGVLSHADGTITAIVGGDRPNLPVTLFGRSAAAHKTARHRATSA